MKKTLIIAITALAGFAASAQYYHTKFGHSRVQYKNFDWFFYSTDNFEVYYYSGGHKYAKEALKYLEKEYVEMTDILGYAPYTKAKLFIYNSVEDLQQSNIGIGGDVYSIGGKTDFVKLQVELAYPGQAHEFREEIICQLGEILVNDMMFGGSLADIFQNSYLLSLPDWFVGGAARYLAYGWSREMDDQVRDYLSNNKPKKLMKTDGYRSEIIGQSIWNYIAIKYGKGSISNILNLTRIIRNEESSFSNTLGVGFKSFLRDWQQYYLVQQEEISKNYRSSKTASVVAKSNKPDVAINHAKISKDGRHLAYALHENGKYKVNIIDLGDGKEKTVEKGGWLIDNQEEDKKLPLIDWQGESVLGMIVFKRGHLYLVTYNLGTGEKLQKPLTRFNQIESFSFNDNGRLAIISGDIDGMNDIFLVSMKRNALKRITKDEFDDIDPVFIPGTATIVFASNRIDDSIKTRNADLQNIDENFNLFLYNLDTTTTSFFRMTNTYSMDHKPIAKNTKEVFYLSDQKGISNLYKYSFVDSTFVQVTNYGNSILDYGLSFGDSAKLAYLMLDDGKKKVFLEEPFDLNRRLFTPQTARQRAAQAQFVINRLKRNEPKKDTLPAKLNSVDSLILPDSYFFENEPGPSRNEEEDFIDTDNYVFEDEREAVAFRPESFLSNYRKFEKQSKAIGPYAYKPRFNFKNLITSFAIDPIRGFSLLFETEINDVLENHRIIGGTQAASNFRSGNLYGEYQFLKYWMDLHVRFRRNTYLINFQSPFLNTQRLERELAQKYTMNRLEIAFALPLSNLFRIEMASVFTNTRFDNRQWQAVNKLPAEVAPNSLHHYGGPRIAMVIDNTLQKEFNSYQGTRGLAEFEYNLGIGDFRRTFGKLKIDLRHYQKIHKELTFATRLFYGKSMGPNRQNFLLGGMDNWIFRTFEDQGTADPLGMSNEKDNSALLFTEFVTNLRGFDYNETYGANALCLNAELRLPFFRYIVNSPISSAFLRNFEIQAFCDLGAAWTDASPLSKNGGVFSKKYATENSPFSAEIASSQNPWLSSYGWGLRSVLLGYYLKVDFAYPVRDLRTGDQRVYFTLGMDF